MPRKKFGKKSSSSLNDVNGVKHAENGKTENGITENEKSKTKSCQSIDSKSSHGSTVSLKKRLSLKKKNFSPFKRNKSPDENGGNGGGAEESRKNGDVVRRTNSLNNISQDGGRSKIPILRPKKNHQNEANKQNGKHELCPTVNKNGNCESRSLVLNPGMDSWRMAGLMETVSNTNLMLNSSNSLSDKNTTNGFGEKSLETVTSDEILHQSSNAVIVTLNTSDTAADVISNDVDPGHHTETVPSGVTKTENVEVPFESHISNSNIAVALIVTPSVNDEPIDLEESAIPIPNTEVECCHENDVVFTQESDITNHQAYVTPEFVSVTPTVLEDIYDVDVYELDNEQFCSVRKLEDFISEHHIELPKEVCCDDWLVLDIAAC